MAKVFTTEECLDLFDTVRGSVKFQAVFYKQFKKLKPKQKARYMDALLAVLFQEVRVSDISFEDDRIAEVWDDQLHHLKNQVNNYPDKRLKSEILAGVTPIDTPGVPLKDAGVTPVDAGGNPLSVPGLYIEHRAEGKEHSPENIDQRTKNKEQSTENKEHSSEKTEQNARTDGRSDRPDEFVYQNKRMVPTGPDKAEYRNQYDKDFVISGQELDLAIEEHENTPSPFN